MVYAHIRIISLHVGGGVYGDIAGIAAGGVARNFADGIAVSDKGIGLLGVPGIFVDAFHLDYRIAQDVR